MYKTKYMFNYLLQIILLIHVTCCNFILNMSLEFYIPEDLVYQDDHPRNFPGN